MRGSFRLDGVGSIDRGWGGRGKAPDRSTTTKGRPSEDSMINRPEPDSKGPAPIVSSKPGWTRQPGSRPLERFSLRGSRRDCVTRPLPKVQAGWGSAGASPSRPAHPIKNRSKRTETRGRRSNHGEDRSSRAYLTPLARQRDRPDRTDRTGQARRPRRGGDHRARLPVAGRRAGRTQRHERRTRCPFRGRGLDPRGSLPRLRPAQPRRGGAGRVAGRPAQAGEETRRGDRRRPPVPLGPGFRRL